MKAVPAYLMAALGGAGLAVANPAQATPQIDPTNRPVLTETAVAALDTPALSVQPKPSETLSCPQSCDHRAEHSLKTCLRTVAALKSDPNWMDDTLSADTCRKAAVAGANQCWKGCMGDVVPVEVEGED